MSPHRLYHKAPAGSNGGPVDIPGRYDLDGTKIMMAEFSQGDSAEILLVSVEKLLEFI